MAGLAVVTVVSRNYLASARVMVDSLRTVAPEAPAWICLSDRPPTGWQVDGEPGKCFFADQLEIPDWRRFAFQYSGLELACALKPWALRHMFRLGYERVLYVDGDVRFYQSPRVWEERLADHDIVLTPHLLNPLGEAWPFEREGNLLRAGTYNGGMVAVRASSAGRAFVDWWSERSLRDFYVDMGGGRFVDQRWLDLVPGLFEKVFIERAAGINAAYWRLWTRELTWAGDASTGSRYCVGAEPLTAFHFSGFDPHRPQRLSTHDVASSRGQADVIDSLCSDYAHELMLRGWDECRAWGYGHATLSDGTAISPYWREAVRWQAPSLASIRDPFLADPRTVALLREVEPWMRRRRVDWTLDDLEPWAPPAPKKGWRKWLAKLLGDCRSPSG